jgi:HAD-hyrolase-like
VLTPVVLAQRLLGEQGRPRLLAVAAPGIRELLERFLVAPDEPATHVLVCDPSYGASYDDLDRAFRAVRAGAELVATQVARIARRDDGEHLDTGGFVRLLEYATGVRARVLGKPSPDFFRLALGTAGVAPERAVMVGDDLAADVAGAQAVGLRGVLVRTGKGSEPHPDATATEPDANIDSLVALPIPTIWPSRSRATAACRCGEQRACHRREGTARVADSHAGGLAGARSCGDAHRGQAAAPVTGGPQAIGGSRGSGQRSARRRGLRLRPDRRRGIPADRRRQAGDHRETRA